MYDCFFRSELFPCVYLIANSFAHEERADMRWHDIVQQQLVDVLDGFHLLLFCFETSVQQEIHTTGQLVLRENSVYICNHKCVTHTN